MQTESPRPGAAGELRRYLDEELRPAFEQMGFACRLLVDPSTQAPFLFAERSESPDLPTVLGYAHGDVVAGMEDRWDAGLSPWTVTERAGRWYGRGIADNKGQHSINLLAQAAVIRARGSLGFNAKWLVEMGEEIGSPGLHAICASHRELLRADVLVASDGPRLNASRPTLFLGSRGELTIDLRIEARETGHHSGNWGGVLSNPAVQLSHAIGCLVGPTGRILVPELVPDGGLPREMREALRNCELEQTGKAPRVDGAWGEPGLTGAEKVFGWSAFEVLAMEAGTPSAPVSAIPPRAWARCQLRFVAGVDPGRAVVAIRHHLSACGFPMVEVVPVGVPMAATRLSAEHPWVRWAASSIEATVNQAPAILPNIGGTIPNDAFSEVLGVPTVWIPHSYPGCQQHAPNEHIPVDLVREAITIMTGLYWDVPQATCAPRL